MPTGTIEELLERLAKKADYESEEWTKSARFSTGHGGIPQTANSCKEMSDKCKKIAATLRDLKGKI